MGFLAFVLKKGDDMAGENKIKTIVFPADLKHRLQEEARRRTCSANALVRLAVIRFLEECETKQETAKA